MTARQTDSTPSIALRTPLGDIFDRLQNEIRERAYQIFLDREPEPGDPAADWLSAESELLSPIELVIKEQKKNIVAECNLKGFTPREIEIEVEDGVLKVFGSHSESHTETNEAGGTQSSTERVYFYQSAQLPAEVDLDESHAKLFKNGKLKVTLPKV